MSLWITLLTLASLAGLAAWIWLIQAAFRNGEKNWGVVLVIAIFVPFVGPLVALVFAIRFWSIASGASRVFVAACVLTLVGTLGLMASLRRMALDFTESPEFAAAARELAEAQADIDLDRSGPTDTSPSEPADAPVPPTPPAQPRPRPQARPPQSPAPSRRPPASSAGNTTDAAQPQSPPIVPPQEPPARDRPFPPVRVETVSLGEPGPNQIRLVEARIRNPEPHGVRELRLGLTYLDANGLRLGRWMTVHAESTNIVAAAATNTFTLRAFFVPQFTRNLRLEVEGVLFDNGDRWPRSTPNLAPSARQAP